MWRQPPDGSAPDYLNILFFILSNLGGGKKSAIELKSRPAVDCCALKLTETRNVSIEFCMKVRVSLPSAFSITKLMCISGYVVTI